MTAEAFMASLKPESVFSTGVFYGSDEMSMYLVLVKNNWFYLHLKLCFSNPRLSAIPYFP